MKHEKFNGFDKNGYLPPGIYHMTYEEFKSILYLTVKFRILNELFGTDKNNIPKGIVHLM